MRFEFRIDKSLLIISALALVSVGPGLLYNSGEPDKASVQNRKPVGKVSHRVNDVRRKAAREIAWKNIPDQDAVYNQDHIFTGDKSQAEIQLDNGAKLSMNSNSLIVIEGERKEAHLQLNYGGFLGHLKPGENLKIKHNGKILSVSPSDADSEVQITQVAQGELSVTVLKGAVDIKAGETTSQLSANHAAIFEEPNSEIFHVRKYQVQLISPNPGEILWLGHPLQPIVMKWLPTPSALKYRVEASRNSDFAKLIFKVDTMQTEISWPQESAGNEEGSLYWRVFAVDSKLEIESPTSIFSYYRASAPQLKSALVHRTQVYVTSNSGDQEVELRWEFGKPYDHFEIEVATDDLFKTTLSHWKDEKQHTGIRLSSGTYYWKVRAMGKSELALPWSDPFKFTIDPSPLNSRAPAEAAQGDVPTNRPPFEPSPLPVTDDNQKTAPLVSEQATGQPISEPVAKKYETVSKTVPEPEVEPTNSAIQAEQVETPKKKFRLKANRINETRDEELSHLAGSLVEMLPNALPPIDENKSKAEAPQLPPIICTIPPKSPDSLIIREPLKWIMPDFWLWVGAGENYQYIKQSIPALDGDSSFQNIAGPSTLFRVGFQGERWGLDATFKNTPGEIKSSDSVHVEGGKYNWKTLSSEGLYRLTSDDPLNFRFGVQNHQMPFMYFNSDTASIQVNDVSLLMATVGLDRSYELADNLRFEWLARYQHPLSTGSSLGATYKVTPKFAFDGSIGGVYQLTKQARIGLYWYGQFHDYGFYYISNGGAPVSGSQVLIYSNLELRLGFEF